jgi:hypothetical protein
MSVVAMPPYPSTIPASAFSPTANDDNVWMATPAAAARRASASICVTDALRAWRRRAVLYATATARDEARNA